MRKFDEQFQDLAKDSGGMLMDSRKRTIEQLQAILAKEDSVYITK